MSWTQANDSDLLSDPLWDNSTIGVFTGPNNSFAVTYITRQQGYTQRALLLNSAWGLQVGDPNGSMKAISQSTARLLFAGTAGALPGLISVLMYNLGGMTSFPYFAYKEAEYYQCCRFPALIRFAGLFPNLTDLCALSAYYDSDGKPHLFNGVPAVLFDSKFAAPLLASSPAMMNCPNVPAGIIPNGAMFTATAGSLYDTGPLYNFGPTEPNVVRFEWYANNYPNTSAPKIRVNRGKWQTYTGGPTFWSITMTIEPDDTIEIQALLSAPAGSLYYLRSSISGVTHQATIQT